MSVTLTIIPLPDNYHNFMDNGCYNENILNSKINEISLKFKIPFNYKEIVIKQYSEIMQNFSNNYRHKYTNNSLQLEYIQITRLLDVIICLLNNNEKLNKDNIELKKDNIELKKDNIELNENYIQLDKDIIQLNKNYIQLDKDIIQLNKNYIQLDKDNIQLKKDNNTYKKYYYIYLINNTLFIIYIFISFFFINTKF